MADDSWALGLIAWEEAAAFMGDPWAQLASDASRCPSPPAGVRPGRLPAQIDQKAERRGRRGRFTCAPSPRAGRGARASLGCPALRPIAQGSPPAAAAAANSGKTRLVQLELAREGEGEQEGGPQGHPSPSSTPYPYRHEQQGDGGGTLWSSIFPDPVVLGRCTCILPQESTTCCAHHVLDQMPHQIGSHEVFEESPIEVV
ncbi:hypothetical protein PVAP13_1KG079077 [Panicum virgatum]|uniref:Uncharacterized protein n=1 Tax=Panicum virgatum TaxID=38727 RepID=A0A8T0XBF1_PANVG|nr:hypothetical protein PVAP13_1KG079077 [Panicum virgatum]